MIELGPSSPSRKRPYRDRQAVELLPHVLEALPVGIGLFELRGDEFTFRYGNREFARVLGLERIPAEGLTLGEIFKRGEHEAIVELFQMSAKEQPPEAGATERPSHDLVLGTARDSARIARGEGGNVVRQAGRRVHLRDQPAAPHSKTWPISVFASRASSPRSAS
jgi:PAS domain-containing protein